MALTPFPGSGDSKSGGGKAPAPSAKPAQAPQAAPSRASGGLTPFPGAASPEKEKKPGGVLGLLGAVGSLLSAPQQVMFKAGRGINDIAQGELGAGIESFKGALGEAATLGQAGGDIDFAQANRQWRGDEATPIKLPKGVNTGAGIVIDPLNFTTFGAGAAAKAATKTALGTLSKEAGERLAKQGLKKGLTEAEQATVRDALVRQATEQGAKNAEKTATRQFDALTQRGRGGIGFHIPGTNVGATVIPGSAFAKAGEATGLTAARDAIKSAAPVRSLSKALIPGRAVAEAVGKEASEKVLSAGSRRFASENTVASDLGKRLDAGVKSFEQAAGRKFTAADDAIVQQALEGGEAGIAAAIRSHPALETLIKAGDDIRRTVTASQIEAGVLDPLLIHADATYLKRLLSPEAQKAFDKAEKAAVRSGSSVSAAMRQTSLAARKIDPDATVEEINRAVATVQAGGTIADEALTRIAQGLPPGSKLFDESALRSLTERGQSAARAVAAAQYIADLRGIVDDVGHPILLSAADVATAGVPHGWKQFDVPKLGTFFAPAELKSEVARFMATIGADDAVSKFDGMLKQWDRWWKVSVTASLPGGFPFALRNARSNMWMMFGDGMPPKYLVEGKTLQRRVAKTLAAHPDAVALEGVEAVLKRELGGRDWQLFDAARREGLIGTGFYAFDLEGLAGAKKLGGGKARKALRAVLGTEGALAQQGLRLNSAIEEHARLSHFLYGVDRFGSIEKAAEQTKLVLFDYARLTPLEQTRLKRAIPFYTFMRKNVPATFRRFVENPARTAMPEKISRAMTDPLDEDAPEYQKRQGARLLKGGPLAGFVSTPERPLQSAVAALEPLAQLAAAATPGRLGGLEPSGGIGQAGRSIISPMGGGPGAALKLLAQEASGKNLLTGYNLKQDESGKRLLTGAVPALGRTPSLTARLPTAEERRRVRQRKQKTLAELAQILGIKFEPQTNAPK